MRVPDQAAGKTVKCPKCAHVFKAQAASPAPAAVGGASSPAKQQLRPAAKQPAGPAAAKKPAAGTTPVVSRTKPVPKVAARQKSDQSEEFEVNEAVEPPPDSAAAKGDAATGGWGLEHLDELDVPDEMQKEIQKELSRGEHIVWATRPRQDVLLHQARKIAYIGGPIATLVGLGGFGAAVYGIINSVTLAIVIGLIFGLVFLGFGLFMFTMPGRVARGEKTRGCYMITNRRLLIHPGKGFRVVMSTSSSRVRRGRGEPMATMEDAPLMQVTPYTGLELLYLARNENSGKFEGTGDLFAGRSIYQEATGNIMQAIDDVRGVEKRIREALVHPIIDKMLRGQLSRDDKEKIKKTDAEDAGGNADKKGEAVAVDSNLKDYGGSTNGDDPNIKAAPGVARAEARLKKLRDTFTSELKKTAEEDREQVEEELTSDEQVLWIASPDAKTKGRGILGNLFGAAVPVEPAYELYAITSRRVILWVKKKPPMSYYSPALADAGVEADDRIPNGGSIIFSRVKLTITTRKREGNRVTTSTRVELHSFGLLRIRNYKAVAEFLYQTLVGPSRSV
jgi:hypothetical protein